MCVVLILRIFFKKYCRLDITICSNEMHKIIFNVFHKKEISFAFLKRNGSINVNVFSHYFVAFGK